MLWPPLTLAFLVVVSIRAHALAFDLGHAYISGAHAVLDGRSPFPPLTTSVLMSGTAYVYPPLTAWLAVPFALLPLPAAEALGIALSVAAVVAVFLVLGVRDWRCYMITFLWVPTYSAIQTANVTLVLLLGVALLWRWRRREVAAGLLLGFLVALKLYLWPLAMCFVATGRYRAVAIAAAASVILIFGPWAPIGFAGLHGYPHLLEVLTRLERAHSYTLGAVLAPMLSWRVANVVTTVVGLAILLGAWRSTRLGDERRGYAYAVAATLVLTPVVHMSYFVFLGVLLALFQPTFGPLWVLPLMLWVGPQTTNGSGWQTVLVLLIAATTALAVIRPRRLFDGLPGRGSAERAASSTVTPAA